QAEVIEVTDGDAGSGHDGRPAKSSNRSKQPIAVKPRKWENQVRNDGFNSPYVANILLAMVGCAPHCRYKFSIQ
ncbi:MAG: hypothetical protein II007_05295, partial [Gammaproteobacteria bacterium]|nr:hypothetical protein [Gammaproteobacteria bacterium]